MQYLHLALTSARMSYAPLEYSFRLLTFSLVWHIYYQVELLPPSLLILRWHNHPIRKIRYTLNPHRLSNDTTPTSE